MSIFDEIQQEKTSGGNKRVAYANELKKYQAEMERCFAENIDQYLMYIRKNGTGKKFVGKYTGGILKRKHSGLLELVQFNRGSYFYTDGTRIFHPDSKHTAYEGEYEELELPHSRYIEESKKQYINLEMSGTIVATYYSDDSSYSISQVINALLDQKQNDESLGLSYMIRWYEVIDKFLEVPAAERFKQYLKGKIEQVN